MAHYDVSVVVEFRGEVHADSREEAEHYAYSNWSAEGGSQIQYLHVVSTKAQETDATDTLDNCPSNCSDVEDTDE
jgi:hypothetical protein